MRCRSGAMRSIELWCAIAHHSPRFACPGMTTIEHKEECTMKLTPQQIEHVNREGWLFLPEVWREKSGAPRTAFAAHLYNEAFGLLGAHPRMIDPIEQIFGEKVYMHQFKINAKAAFTG